MLLNLHKKDWTSGLKLVNFDQHTIENQENIKVLIILIVLEDLWFFGIIYKVCK